MDQYSKLTKAVPVQKLFALFAATAALEHWIVPYGIWNIILTDNELQFVTRCFAALFASTDWKPVTTTEYNAQSEGQVKKFNKTRVPRLRYYTEDHR